MLETFCRVMNIAGRMVTFTISYKIDNKVINALTGAKSTQSCNLCNVKPNEVNNIDLVKAKQKMSQLWCLEFQVCTAG